MAGIVKIYFSRGDSVSPTILRSPMKLVRRMIRVFLAFHKNHVTQPMRLFHAIWGEVFAHTCPDNYCPTSPSHDVSHDNSWLKRKSWSKSNSDRVKIGAQMRKRKNRVFQMMHQRHGLANQNSVIFLLSAEFLTPPRERESEKNILI